MFRGNLKKLKFVKMIIECYNLLAGRNTTRRRHHLGLSEFNDEYTLKIMISGSNCIANYSGVCFTTYPFQFV